MTLSEQTILVDSMIKENKEVTIKDFIELKKEIDGIKKASREFIIRGLIKKKTA